MTLSAESTDLAVPARPETEHPRPSNTWPWTGAASEPMLSVGLDTDGAVCRLTLQGTLGSTSVAALQAQFDQLGCISCERVVIDAGRLQALDAVGLNVLLGLHHYVRGRGGRLEVIGASLQVMAVLAGTALDRRPWSLRPEVHAG